MSKDDTGHDTFTIKVTSADKSMNQEWTLAKKDIPELIEGLQMVLVTPTMTEITMVAKSPKKKGWLG